jgi:hypothetical protein
MKKIVLQENIDRALFQIFAEALKGAHMQILDAVNLVRSSIEDDPIEVTSEKIVPIVEA